MHLYDNVYHIFRYSFIKLANARGRVFYGRIPALWHLEDTMRFVRKIRYLHLNNRIARFHYAIV